MVKPKTKICPCCNSEQIVVTRLKSMAQVVQSLDLKSAIFMEICVDCGTVVSQYAEHPTHLKGDK